MGQFVPFQNRIPDLGAPHGIQASRPQPQLDRGSRKLAPIYRTHSPRIVDFTFPLCYFLTMNVPALMATYQLRQREYLRALRGR